MDISKFLNKPKKKVMQKRAKEESKIITNLLNKKLLGRLSDAEKKELHELCYNRYPVFVKKSTEKIKARYGEAFSEVDE
ncbi:MAG: hypothetical protein KAI71_02045 [Candidatus Pacebacteria bacterium]|nr:hypothetical protein [Candidatus Paceibacterota bacterium]